MSTQRKRVLFELAGSGSSTARQISKKLGLPINKVYGFLSDLRDSELVYADVGLYGETAYVVNKLGLLTMLEEERRSHSTAIEQLDQIEKRITTLPERLSLQLSPEIWIGPAKDAPFYTSRLMGEARHSIEICTYVFSWFDKVERILRTKAKEGVCISVLMATPSTLRLPIEYSKQVVRRSTHLKDEGIEVFHTSTLVPFRGSVVDRCASIVMIHPYVKPAESNTSDRYLVCRNKAIVSIVSDYYRKCCEDASEQTA